MLSIGLNRKWLWLKFVFLVVVLGVLISGLSLFIIKNNTLDGNIEAPFLVKKKSEPTAITSNVLFLGNTFWGRNIDDWSKASGRGVAYPFSRLNEFGRDKYNAWIAGLECPTANGINMTSAEMEQNLQFNCSPEYLPEATKWFTAFSLANNHTDNHGADGFMQTQQNLDKNNIQYFGHYDLGNAADACEVISLPVDVENDDKSIEKGELPVALCGYHGVFGIPTPETAEQISKYSPYMPVIAMPHMGAEYKPSADEIKTNFYRSLIDAGADMVIGDHPHWVQNSESYKGHLIIYSTGNFMFDQQGSLELTRSAGINVLMKTDNEDSKMLEKWLKIGPSCRAFKDNCLDQIIGKKLTKLKINYQVGIIGSSCDERIAKPATDEQLNGILQRLNWQTTSKQLQAPYSSL